MSLRGFQSFDESGLTEVLEDNLISLLDYGFVEKGGYFNSDSAAGVFNGQDQLYKINDPRRTDGTVWASRRKNWVWETGEGIGISGVWVNDTLMTSGYSINYRDGAVIFDEAQSGTVKVNHSHKYIHVFDATSTDLFKGDKRSFDVTDSIFINGSGFGLPDNRIQLPAIGIEVLTGKTSTPFEIGNLSQNTKTRVLCNILAKDGAVAKRISDYLTYQKDKTFVLFDRDMVADSGYYPLNYDGTLNNPSGTYQYLSENFEYAKVFARKAYFSNIVSEDLNRINQDLIHLTVRLELECVF